MPGMQSAGADEKPRIDLVMPVHNEGQTIEATLREWHDEVGGRIALRFLIEEDGSTDDTKEVLRRLSAELPLSLGLVDERRGYGAALIAGLREARTEWVLTCDSDGQMDPGGFWSLWEIRDEFDVVVGWRVNRIDKPFRKLLSGAFKLLHRSLFGVSLHDPSCNLVLMRRPTLEALLPRLGRMSEGFWWEFIARLARQGRRIGEAPVHHRSRAAGSTRVYMPVRIPGIAWRNTLALLRIWLER